MNKRELQKQKTCESLKKNAVRLFVKQGILVTTTKQIAQESGVSHGALFVHFSRRDDLIAEIINDFLGSLAKSLQQLIENSNSVEAFLAAYIDGLSQQEELYRRIIQEIPFLPDYSRSTLLSIQASISLQLFSLINKEVKSGKIKNLRQDYLFNTWIALVNHLILNKDIFTDQTNLLAEKKIEIIDFFMHLITKDTRS